MGSTITTAMETPSTAKKRHWTLTNRNTILDSEDEDEAQCRSFFDKKTRSRPRPASTNTTTLATTVSLVPAKRKTPMLPATDTTKVALPHTSNAPVKMDLPLHTKSTSPSSPSPLTTLPPELLQTTFLSLLLSHLHTPFTGDRDFLRTLLALTSTSRVLRIHAIAVLRMLRQEISVGGGLVRYVARPLEMRVMVLALDWRFSRVELGGEVWRGGNKGGKKSAKMEERRGEERKDEMVRRVMAREERKKRDRLAAARGSGTTIWDERYGCL
jgi:hypothetical protein